MTAGASDVREPGNILMSEEAQMKALGITGSPRKGGNSELIPNHARRAMAEEGIETELISLAGLTILPCTACMACQKEERCIIEDDLMPIYEKMKAADCIILTTPVYYGSATALIKGLMERAGYVARHAGNQFKGKVGGPLVVARRGGMTSPSRDELLVHILGST